MNKKFTSLFSLLLLFSLIAGIALASSVHPSQMGDSGGAFAASRENPNAAQPNYSPSNNASLQDQIPYEEPQTSSDSNQTVVYNTNPVTGDGTPSTQPAADSSYNWINNEAPAQSTSTLPDLSSQIPTENPVETMPAVDPNANASGVEEGTQTPIIIVPEDTTSTNTEQATIPETSDTSSAQTLNWFNDGGQELLAKYPNIRVYDINAGVSWNARYINGKNHADVIPASAADNTTLANNNITGSYVRRPVLVTINGTQYAGSMYAVGHGTTSYCNYFKGVMCIHFTGSMTHGSKKVDQDHQNAISTALQYGN